jgi:hypothetical protein
MREYCTSGSVAGAPGNRSPYAGGSFMAALIAKTVTGTRASVLNYWLHPTWSAPMHP